MTTLEEALRMIRERSVTTSRTEEIDIVRSAGFVLAETIVSNINMPPFNRATMDGYAFRHADACPGVAFRIVGTIGAGLDQETRLGATECVRIMTGSPVPADADTVIPVEQTEEGGDQVRFISVPDKAANIAPRGSELKVNDFVLRAGHRIGTQEIGILAAVGRKTARIYAPPAVAFMATGDELADPGASRGSAQIWNANGYVLHTQIRGVQAIPHDLGIALDRKDDLREKIRAGLERDFLLISGGVSRGRFDFVPEVLAEFNVEKVFWKLQVKPGHPTFFGVRGSTLVFGLPGNPISTLLAFELYAAPAIRRFMHDPHPDAARYSGVLTAEVSNRSGRLHLVPCVSEWRDGGFLLAPLRTGGSADIFAIAGADAVAITPPEMTHARKGDTVTFFKLGQR